jgi:SAM-dependent methyltransferase
MPGDRDDVWAIGAAYEPYVGRWSTRVARKFLHWLDVPGGSRWIDVGCGTGALSEAVIASESPSQLLGVDASEGFVKYARARIRDTRARFEVGDARNLPAEGQSLDAAVSGLVINFVPDPQLAVAEMTRVVKPGGIVGVYVWDYAGRMELMRRFWDAAVALDPAAQSLDEGRRFPICNPGALEALFRASKLAGVQVKAFDVPTPFRDFDDYWNPFLGGQGPAPTYVMSLDDERRTKLRERLRSNLPTGADGSITLIARAWAVRGTRAEPGQ